MAAGSAEEVQVWLEFALELGYIDQPQAYRWTRGYDEVSKMLGALMKRRDEEKT